MTKIKFQEKPSSSLAFEEAREAVVKIKTLKPLLSPKDEETLSILMDKELRVHLNKSLMEEKGGKVEPLENVLK
ncbi:MAG TPA: hypothetical protein VF303_00205 [Candidatus Nanoarchaeia archaeon]